MLAVLGLLLTLVDVLREEVLVLRETFPVEAVLRVAVLRVAELVLVLRVAVLRVAVLVLRVDVLLLALREG